MRVKCLSLMLNRSLIEEILATDPSPQTDVIGCDL